MEPVDIVGDVLPQGGPPVLRERWCLDGASETWVSSGEVSYPELGQEKESSYKVYGQM